MKKLLVAVIFGVLLISAAAAYRFIPSVRNLFIVSEHPDIPAFIDSSMDIRKEGDVEKLKSLTEVGFTSFNSKLRRIENRKLYDSIYSGKRFISDEVLGDLLKKFNLAYSTVSDFICEVPDFNLKEIRDFSTKYPVGEVVEEEITGGFMWTDGQVNNIRRDEKTGALYYRTRNDLLIVAPSTCLKSTIGGYTPDGKAIVKDPIVLYKVESGYIIVTSW